MERWRGIQPRTIASAQTAVSFFPRTVLRKPAIAQREDLMPHGRVVVGQEPVDRALVAPRKRDTLAPRDAVLHERDRTGVRVRPGTEPAVAHSFTISW